MVAQMTLDAAQKEQSRKYVMQLLKAMDDAYVQLGFERSDLAVALAGLMEICYEMHHGTFKIGDPKGTEKNQTRAAVRQMQRALGGIPAFTALPDRNKQTACEAASFSAAHLEVMWHQAAGDVTKQNEMRQLARQQFLGLMRIDFDAITRNAAGEFVPKSGATASAGGTAPNVGAAKPTTNSVWKNTG